MNVDSGDGFDLAALIGAASTLLLVVSAWLRRRMRSGRPLLGSFRPRAHLRAYLSLRTHKSGPPGEIEPGPFDDEADTSRRKKLPP